MVVGSTRKTVQVTAAALAAALLWAAPASAVEAENPCQAPAQMIYSAGPLPRMERLLKASSKKIKVLAIGSSSTVGVGASAPRFTYTSMLEGELGRAVNGLNVKIITRGVSGEIADGTAERIKLEVALTRPDLVLWQVGTNDALARVPVSEFAQTVSRTLKWLKGANVDVVLVGMQYTKKVAKDAHYKLIKDALKQVAQEENVALVKRYDAMQYMEEARAKMSFITADDLHLNDLGYRCMAEHVARGILVSVFPKAPEAKAALSPTQ